MRFRMSAAMALVVAASLACDTVDTGGVAGPVRDVDVTTPNNTFLPDAVTIPVGGRVMWVGSGVEHNVNFGGVQPDAPSGCGRWSFGDCIRQFPVAGTFNYNCTFHPGMVGRVTVQ